MNLFQDVQSDKDQSEIEPLGMQPCTQLLYFTIDERTEFKALVKEGIKQTSGEDATKENISDFILDLLRNNYGGNN